MHKCVKKNENKTTIKNKNTVLSAMNKRIRFDWMYVEKNRKKYHSTDIISITVAIRKREQKIFISFVYSVDITHRRECISTVVLGIWCKSIFNLERFILIRTSFWFIFDKDWIHQICYSTFFLFCVRSL